MTAPTVVQSSSLSVASTSVTNLTISGVSSGSTLVVLLANTSTSTRSYAVSDDQGNTWSSVGSIVGRNCRIAYATGAVSGNTQITVTQSGGSFTTYSFLAVEVSESTFVEESTYSDGTNNTTHYMAASGKLDAILDAIILGIGVHNASGGTLTKGTNHTLLITPTTTAIAQYIRSDAGFVDERSTWTSTTARSTHGASAAFEAAVGGPTSYTLIADSGSFTLSGQNANTLANRVVTGEVGSLVLAGQDAGLLAGRKVTGEAGAFTFTGQSAGLIAARKVVGEAGTFTLAGQDATLTYSPVGGFSLSAEAAAFSFAGQSANLRATRLLGGETAAFVLTGQAANLTQSAVGVEVDANAFAITDLTTTWAW